MYPNSFGWEGMPRPNDPLPHPQNDSKTIFTRGANPEKMAQMRVSLGFWLNNFGGNFRDYPLSHPQKFQKGTHEI